MKIKRKKRNKIDKKTLDFMKPITIDKFGTEEDPCFGKFYSPDAKECNVCGDSEVCMIIQAQKQNAVRLKIESKGNYMDLEETEIPMEELHKYLKGLFKKRGKNRLKYSYLCKVIKSKFDPNSLLNLSDIRRTLKSCIKTMGGFKLVKSNGIKYIKKLK